VILEGELRVYLADRSLPEHAVFGVGDCVGEMSLLDGQAASALVLAAKDTRLVAVPHETLWAMVDSSHGVARNLLALMAGRMRNDNLALITSQNRSLEFEQAASVDALTGIHNRRWLMEAYPRAIARCDRDEQPVCLLIADIDHFKRFNDRFGHLTGDVVLRRVSRQLADGLRAQDLIARYGGEEFLILLPQATGAQALPIAERLRELVAANCGCRSGRCQLRRGRDAAGGITGTTHCTCRRRPAAGQGKRPRSGRTGAARRSLISAARGAAVSYPLISPCRRR
jgi:diguanylate cyclase (GGDEF)-like protein